MVKITGNKQIAFRLAVLGILAVSAYFVVNVSLPPWSHWLSGINVILFALPAFWVTRWWLGWRDTVLLWALLGGYALLVETSALLTGFPYGHFGYSDLLGAKLFGTTPWTVFLAWTPIILGVYGAAANMFSNAAGRVVSTAILATAVDLVLDPGAVRLLFWQYDGGGWWYGVPWKNFGGWLLTSVVAAILVEVFIRIRKPLLPTPVRLVLGVIPILVFWIFVSYFAKMTAPSLVGSALMIGLSLLYLRTVYYFDEMIVLCDDAGGPIATMAKAEVHTGDTPLHLAFSVFIFNSKGDLLLQCRSTKKKTWPGVWSNSCCGHQMLHEKPLDGAKRRLKYELGLHGIELHCILPEYRYRAQRDGVVENEICPVFVGYTDTEPAPNFDEVETYLWQPWREFLERIRRPESDISPWAREEAELLEASPEFRRFAQYFPVIS